MLELTQTANLIICCNSLEMGTVFARRVIGIENPRIGLLSNGIEETKGNRLVVEAQWNF